MTQPSTRDGQAGSMPAGARTRRPMNTPKSMSFTITTGAARKRIDPAGASPALGDVRCAQVVISGALGGRPPRAKARKYKSRRPDQILVEVGWSRGRATLGAAASSERCSVVMVSTKSFRWECSKPAVEMGAPSLSVEGEGQRLRGRNRTYAPAGLSGVWAVAPPDAVGDQLGLVRVHERFRYGVLQRVSDGPDRCEHRMVDERLRVVGL